MIDYLIGVVQEIHNQEIVFENGLIGIRLHVPRVHTFIQGEQAKIYVYMHWNAENGPSFYGFSSIVERAVFCIIISCSGIGPKLGLAILSDLGAINFIQAVEKTDEQALSKVTGIGKKKAEQIIVALKHKIAAFIEAGHIVIDDNVQQNHMRDVAQALQSLHYARNEINEALDYIRKNSNITDVSFDHLLRQALIYLSKQI